jgi:cyclopropane-fatty-acyl-phospholipid synthase
MLTLDISSEDRVERSTIGILEELTAGYPHIDFAVRLWDGTQWGNLDNPDFTLVLNHPGALRNMFMSPNELTLGEAYVKEDFDIEGDIQNVFKFGYFLLDRHFTVSDKLRLQALLRKLPKGTHVQTGQHAAELDGTLHSQERDRRAISHHYDISNDFYKLWLDQRMVYSCAYFLSPEDSLDQAQVQKLDYICKKLRLKKGETFLDLGCGWGGLVMHAAKNYGVRALGITNSVQQAELAQERIRQAGLTDLCEVQIIDYRALDKDRQFDKIASVGMFEHVGEALLPEYFQRAWDHLRPGGVFLNHGIASSVITKRKGPSFIDKYVFPDGDLVSLSTSLGVAEASGFEVRDVESLREHYEMTLRHWVQRLQEKSDEGRKIAGESIYRVWRLYMSGSARAFAIGRVNVYQVLLSRPDHGVSGLPLTREDWIIR